MDEIQFWDKYTNLPDSIMLLSKADIKKRSYQGDHVYSRSHFPAAAPVLAPAPLPLPSRSPSLDPGPGPGLGLGPSAVTCSPALIYYLRPMSLPLPENSCPWISPPSTPKCPCEKC